MRRSHIILTQYEHRADGPESVLIRVADIEQAAPISRKPGAAWASEEGLPEIYVSRVWIRGSGSPLRVTQTLKEIQRRIDHEL